MRVGKELGVVEVEVVDVLRKFRCEHIDQDQADHDSCAQNSSPPVVLAWDGSMVERAVWKAGRCRGGCLCERYIVAVLHVTDQQRTIEGEGWGLDSPVVTARVIIFY